ncbi:MAG TPA: hypothetical protein VFU35_14065, partial [Jatrophihabitans sp.]|nr:hypothetical protein [Jatrophihabitans sp.]
MTVALFTRRERPPADVVARLGRDESVLAWADTNDDEVIVASRAGLWWPESDGQRLIKWQHVDKAVWRDGYLTVIEADVVD